MGQIAVPEVQPQGDKLRRVGINDLKRELALTREPLVVTSGGKPVGIIYPYDPKMDKQIKEDVQRYKAGEVSYAQYTAEMMAAGMEALANRLVLVRPSDIVAMESLEEKKRSNKFNESMALMSFKMWAGRHKIHSCSNCGHEMLPADVYESEILNQGDNLSNGQHAIGAGNN